MCITLNHRHKLVCEQKHKAQSSAAASAPPSSEISVTWSDQQHINTFSRLNLRLQNLSDELQSKRSELANTDDALGDIGDLLDDDVGTCKIRVGQVYVSVTNEAAEEYGRKHQTTLQTQVKQLEEQTKQIRAEMNELKSKLYAKFGDQINLEYDEKQSAT